jgi:predicted nuclease of restriction endonuclease-like RecB superfamily
VVWVLTPVIPDVESSDATDSRKTRAAWFAQACQPLSTYVLRKEQMQPGAQELVAIIEPVTAMWGSLASNQTLTTPG